MGCGHLGPDLPIPLLASNQRTTYLFCTVTIVCWSLGVQSLNLIFLFINGEMSMQEACKSGGVENKLTQGQKVNCTELDPGVRRPGWVNSGLPLGTQSALSPL